MSDCYVIMSDHRLIMSDCYVIMKYYRLITINCHVITMNYHVRLRVIAVRTVRDRRPCSQLLGVSTSAMGMYLVAIGAQIPDTIQARAYK